MFRQLAAVRLHELARHAQLRRVAKDAVLYERGEPAAGCHALVRGQAKLSLRAPGGAEKVLRLVSAGETFGEPAVFDARPQPVTARALAASEVVFLPRPALLDLIERDRAFARAMLDVLSRRVHALMADMEAHALATGTQRLAAFLCALADDSGPAPVRLPIDVDQGTRHRRRETAPRHRRRNHEPIRRIA